MKKTFSIIAIIFGFLYIIAAFALTIPGMGLQSQLFIDSVQKQITKVMPKGKYVLDPTSPLFSHTMNTIVKKSYQADALSTLNYNKPEYNEFKDQYLAFTDAWFDKYWGDAINQAQSIDFYDIAMNMIDFDVAIAQEFQSYGYVNTGIQWIFHKNGLRELFTSDLTSQSLVQQTVIDQQVYEAELKASNNMLTGLNVTSSPGVLLVNNKTWFINQQIDTLSQALKVQNLENPFVDKELSIEDLAEKITPDALYQPNFTMWKNITLAGFILACSALIITPTLVVFGSMYIHKNRKARG